MHAWFHSKSYTMISTNYGSPFNGHMGVAVAFPNTSYDLVDCDIERVGQCRKWAKLPKVDTPEPGVVASTMAWAAKLPGGLWKALAGAEEKRERPKQDEWEMTQGRHNRMVSVKVKAKGGGRPFVVSTYHMPCMFYAPKVMVIHTALAAQHAQKFAASDPLVLCGDWNFKPYDAAYRLITTGDLDSTDPCFPSYNAHDPYRITHGLEKMRSAYTTVHGSEPDFTNYAQTVRDTEPFIDCLDYIFISKEFDVEDMLTLPNRADVAGPLPIESEPSDHILLQATLSLAKL